MILLAVSALLMATPSGTMTGHRGPLNEGSILLLDEIDLASNKDFVSNLSLKEKEYSLKRSEGGLTLQVDSTSSPQQTLKVQTTDDSLKPMLMNLLERFP